MGEVVALDVFALRRKLVALERRRALAEAGLRGAGTKHRSAMALISLKLSIDGLKREIARASRAEVQQ